MSTKAIFLIGIGILVFIIGWAAMLSGVEVKTCSTYVYVPREFVGRMKPQYSEWYYWRNVPVNLSNIELKANTPFNYTFSVNSTIGYIYIEISGRVSNENYEGYVAILNATNNQTVIYSSLSPSEAFFGKGLNTTLFYQKPLNPGKYKIVLQLNTDAIVNRLAVYGPSSKELEIQAIEITLAPESESAYQQIKIDYICGISFAQALAASTAVGIGISMIVAGALIEAVSTRITRLRIAKPAKAKKK